MTVVEKSIEVDVPIRTAYDQWTQFEEFPQFMGGVEQVEQLDERTLRWVARIAGVRRQWIATILEQIPDSKIAWAATEGATNAGTVSFRSLGPARTLVTLHLDHEPEGLVEQAGETLGLIEHQVRADLDRFRALIQTRGVISGAGRGETTDQQDVVDVLRADHREVAELIARIELSADPAERRELVDTLISELVRHAVAEETYVYPAMRDHLPDGETAVRRDTGAHRELERIMKDLESVDPSDARFGELLQRLESVFTDHVTDEEADQFPRLRAAVPRAVLVDLATRVKRAKRLAPTRPHPLAPDAPLFHKIVGPGAGLVDRLRDHLTSRRSTSAD